MLVLTELPQLLDFLVDLHKGIDVLVRTVFNDHVDYKGNYLPVPDALITRYSVDGLRLNEILLDEIRKQLVHEVSLMVFLFEDLPRVEKEEPDYAVAELV
jgi:hypothetical protein